MLDRPGSATPHQAPFKSELGDFANPACYNKPLDITGEDPQVLLAFLRKMILIRLCEQTIANLVRDGEVKCPCHLGVGQEAIAVGVTHHLTPRDQTFSAHRSHAHFLALVDDPAPLLHEVLGKATGSSRGMGGSQHLIAADKGFTGSNPIVGGVIPVAVGAALANKMDGQGHVATVFFGDGASEEGGLHECLNLAANFVLPTLFVCENNFYASQMDICLRQPSDRISRFAEAHRVEVRVVDGNDVLAVSRAAKELIAAARTNQRPGFLETITYRWLGHVGHREDIDVGIKRKLDDLKQWKLRDPIARLQSALQAAGHLTPAAFAAIQHDVQLRIDRDVELARAAPFPDPAVLLDYVYCQSGS
ncbi:MAG: thiamine pyrophosphate-dependent dehydrogenase E1 component subunit alpha [Magnetococcales bacterium]|nr:thiamine pyrophosphate-dependent dehydrogenase E1 component subunit alpha [Magnetococcales bacterium]